MTCNAVFSPSNIATFDKWTFILCCNCVNAGWTASYVNAVCSSDWEFNRYRCGQGKEEGGEKFSSWSSSQEVFHERVHSLWCICAERENTLYFTKNRVYTLGRRAQDFCIRIWMFCAGSKSYSLKWLCSEYKWKHKSKQQKENACWEGEYLCLWPCCLALDYLVNELKSLHQFYHLNFQRFIDPQSSLKIFSSISKRAEVQPLHSVGLNMWGVSLTLWKCQNWNFEIALYKRSWLL